jgi:hypothetical protein
LDNHGIRSFCDSDFDAGRVHQVFFNPDGADAPSVKVRHRFFSGERNLASNKAGACLP